MTVRHEEGLRQDCFCLVEHLESRSLLSAGTPGYQIDLRFPDNSLTLNQRTAVSSAAVRWQQVIIGDLPDATGDFDDDGTDETIDDLRIDAKASAIDGPGGALASFSVIATRAADGLPIAGAITFDIADAANLESGGKFDEVVLHEMAHTMGFGTLWSAKGLVTGLGTADPRYTGAAAIVQYKATFGASAAQTIPVENTGGAGLAGMHWREDGLFGTAFDTELMSSSLENPGVNEPISRITIAQFADLGYLGVNLNGFGRYAPGMPLPTVTGLSDGPDPAPANSSILLTADTSTLFGEVVNVRFYRETNGITGLQVFHTDNGDIPGDTLVAIDSAPNDGFAVNVSTGGLASGDYRYYAQATDNQNRVSENASTFNTIGGDLTAPVVANVAINGTALQRSNLATVSIRFSEATNLSALIASGTIDSQIQLFNKANPGTPLALDETRFQYNGSTNTLALDLTVDGFGGSGMTQLVNGRFELRLNVAAITDAAGNPLADNDGVVNGTLIVDRSSGAFFQDFFRLGGDLDGDADVDLSDLGVLAGSFGINSAGGDCDDDGDTDLNDLGLLASGFNTSLPAARQAFTASGSAPVTSAATIVRSTVYRPRVSATSV